MGVPAKVTAYLLAPFILIVMIALNPVDRPTYLMGDFRAFYCAGAVIAHGANPYLEEPLRSCERTARPPEAPSFLDSVTLPAPLPPYALLAFVPLSYLPFPVAAGFYVLLLIAAMSVAVLLFARVTGVSSVWLNLAFAGITATVTYYVGQPTPFVFLALAAAALFARRRCWVVASACIVFATVEPQLALPALAAMLVALPKTRLPIAGFGLLLAAGAVAGVGWPTSVAYVRDVLPAHALANAYEWQFSLTSILTSIGIAAPQAVRWGEAMYAVMLLVGVVIAWRLWRATGDRAAIVLIPPAFAVFGGIHVHFQQLALAFPAILYVYARYPQQRAPAATGIALAMVPWNVIGSSALAGFAPLLVGAFAGLTIGRRRGLILAISAAGIGLSLLALAYAGFGPQPAHFIARSFAPDGLAEGSWGEFSRAILGRPSLLAEWLRIPTMAGLALGLFAIARAAFVPVAASSGGLEPAAAGA